MCPTDADELDVFRQEFSATTFWCGILLGGCGGQLLTRRGNVRVSHFAHFPDPDGLLPECGHRSRGIASADHLYVRTTTQKWLRDQGHTPRYRYHDHAESPAGSLVEIDLGGHTLMLHLDPATPPDWEATTEADVILGPGVPIDHRTLVRRGYVNRVKFISEGSQRVMVLGTELPHVGTDWSFGLTDCTVDEHGRLITPVVTRWKTALASAQQAPVPQPRTEKPESPVQIGALTRLIQQAVRQEETAVVRELRNIAQLQVPRCEGQALAHLQRAIEHADGWISRQDGARWHLFDRLEKAIGRGHDRDVTTLIHKIRKFLLNDVTATPQEAAVLEAADALLSEARRRAAQERREAKARREAAARERAARHAAEAEELMKLRQAQLQEQQEQARERKERNRARGRVQCILGQLRREGEALSSEQRQELVEELVLAAEGAGDILSLAEMHKVNEYAERVVVPVGEPDAPNVTASSTQPPVPELAPEKGDVDAAALSAHLVPTAAAVRGALKKAARERTSTSWSRLELQLGSARNASRCWSTSIGPEPATSRSCPPSSRRVTRTSPTSTTAESSPRSGWTPRMTTRTFAKSWKPTPSRPSPTGGPAETPSPPGRGARAPLPALPLGPAASGRDRVSVRRSSRRVAGRSGWAGRVRPGRCRTSLGVTDSACHRALRHARPSPVPSPRSRPL
ncbi:hypothetical protein [Streptomyces sp. ID05-18]|uniref:hypothetical protein n=1 Tax=Streptomyces sp. ID05-18 TaxID=3028662 RepID=UPI0029A2ABB6|nr:hypothetical protein [Streptomyces sp. ID05-18]MDX3488359.1 hypothetical protein [Streptomyces sp. ID05-18]